MRTAVDDERESTAAFELAAGGVAVVAAAFAAAAAFGPREPIGRVLIMGVAAGLLAVLVREWRAVAGVAAIAALVYVGFLAHRAGQLSGDPTPWPYTLVIGLAALLGRGWRRVLITQRDGPRTTAVDTRVSARRDNRPPATTRPFSVGY